MYNPTFLRDIAESEYKYYNGNWEVLQCTVCNLTFYGGKSLPIPKIYLKNDNP